MTQSGGRRTKGVVAAAAANADRRPAASTPQAGIANGEVARRAYELYLARGAQHGHDLDDWLQAERELGAGAARTA